MAANGGRLRGAEPPPRCPQCRAIVRPGVVLFGETLPRETVESMYDQLDAGFDAVFSIGTTSVFPYIAGPVEAARRRGWATIEINPAATRVSRLVDIKLPMRAAEAMEAIWTRHQTQSQVRRAGTGARRGRRVADLESLARSRKGFAPAMKCHPLSTTAPVTTRKNGKSVNPTSRSPSLMKGRRNSASSSCGTSSAEGCSEARLLPTLKLAPA